MDIAGSSSLPPSDLRELDAPLYRMFSRSVL